MRDPELWVELVGATIVARLRGTPSAELLRACEQRVVELARGRQHVRVLYDALEMAPPEVDLVLLQQQWVSEKREAPFWATLRIAILVPDTRTAYLARLAFGQVGEDTYRVFYNDLGAAMKWLEAPVA